MCGLHHDGGHCGLDAVEEAGDQRHLAESDIHPRQDNQNQQRGQHEQHTGHNAAPSPMHQPADIRSQLLRLGARKHHAVIECMQEAPFGDPAPVLDQLLMHDRNLPGWTTKADETHLQPEGECLPKINGLRRGCSDGVRLRSGWGHVVGVPVSKLASKPSKTIEAAASN